MEGLSPLAAAAGVDETIISTANQRSLRELTALLRQKSSAVKTFCLSSDRCLVTNDDDDDDDDDDDFNDPACWNDFCQTLQEAATSIQKLSMDIPETLSDRYLQLARATNRCLQNHAGTNIRILELRPQTILGNSFRRILYDYNDDDGNGDGDITASEATTTTRALLQRIDTLQITCSFAYHSFQSYHDHEMDALCDWLRQTFDIGYNNNHHNHNHNLTIFRLDGYRVHSHRRLLTTLHSLSLSLKHSLQHISLSGLQAYLDGRREPVAECESLAQVLCMPHLRTLELAGLVLAPCHATTLAQTLTLCSQQRRHYSNNNNNNRFLTSLSLHMCRFPDGGGQVIATALEQADCPLQSLTIQSTRIGTSRRVDSVIPLKDISPRLEILHLTHSELDDAACQRISQGLALGRHRLKEFHLDSSQVSVKGMSALMQSLQYNQTLQVLSIQNMDMSDSTISIALAAALQTNRTLQSLKLDACSLSDDCLELLVDAIVVVSAASNGCLQTVNLSHHTGVTNAVIARSIPKLLLQCKNLNHVDLSGVIGDPLSDEEGQAALHSLQANYEMQHFCIDVENMNIQLQMETIARLNKAGRRYLTSDLSSREDGVRVLSKVNDNVNDVFTHLQENPGLCAGF